MFVVFEGIDGAGKSTAMRGVAQRLREDGYRVETLSEIGSEVTGRAANLRRQLMACDDPRDQLQIIMLARRLAQVKVRRWLDEGAVVLQDRYVLSTLAYQGTQMMTPPMTLVGHMYEQNEFLKPDVTLVLDIDQQAARKRLSTRRALDRFDSMPRGRFDAIRSVLTSDGLLQATSRDGLVIDASNPAEKVTDMAAAAVTYKLALGRQAARA